MQEPCRSQATGEPGTSEPMGFVAFGEANNGLLQELFVVAIQEHWAGSICPGLGPLGTANHEISLAVVPAHQIEQVNIAAADMASVLAKEVSFKKLAGARINLCNRDLFLRDHSNTPRVLFYSMVVKCIESIGCWWSEVRAPHDSAKLFDLVWDSTSPYVQALQFISCLLSGDCKHEAMLLVEPMLRILSPDQLQQFDDYVREGSICVHCWLHIRGPARTGRPEIQALGYADFRRSDVSRDSCIFELVSSRRSALSAGWGQRIYDVVTRMIEENEHIDVEFLVLLFYILATLVDGHTQDVEALHASLHAMLRRCGGASDMVPFHHISSRATNKQISCASNEIRELVQATLKPLADIFGDAIDDGVSTNSAAAKMRQEWIGRIFQCLSQTRRSIGVAEWTHQCGVLEQGQISMASS